MSISNFKIIVVIVLLSISFPVSADCWRLPNGQITEAKANSSPPVSGAQRVQCPSQQQQQAQQQQAQQQQAQQQQAQHQQAQQRAQQEHQQREQQAAQQRAQQEQQLQQQAQQQQAQQRAQQEQQRQQQAQQQQAQQRAQQEQQQREQQAAQQRAQQEQQRQQQAQQQQAQQQQAQKQQAQQQQAQQQQAQQQQAQLRAQQEQQQREQQAAQQRASQKQPVVNNSRLALTSSPPLASLTVTQSYECKGCLISPRTKKPTGFHTGVDLRAAIGTEVLAVRGGTVNYIAMGSSNSPTNHGLGNVAILSADDGYFYLYAHLSESIKTGRVYAGEVIAKSGNSGGVDPHLHLEKKTKPVLADPVTGTRYGYTDPLVNSQTPSSLGYLPPQ